MQPPNNNYVNGFNAADISALNIYSTFSSILLFIYFVVLKTGSQCVTQAGLEFTIM